MPSNADFRTFDVDEKTVRLGMALGLMRYDAHDKVYEFTPKGAEWFNGWLDGKLAEVAKESS